MEKSLVQSVKLQVVSITGLSKDALHVYVGMSVFLFTAAISRRSMRSRVPWLATLGVAFAGELVDAIDDLHTIGHWQWRASVHDVINTLVWPTALAIVARFTALLRR